MGRSGVAVGVGGNGSGKTGGRTHGQRDWIDILVSWIDGWIKMDG